MAGTRHSPSAPSSMSYGQHSSSPPPDTSCMSKKQIAALKKLQIDGSDALKGDVSSLEKAKRERESRQVYHFRGAVYEIDPSLTREEWIAQQPMRWRKKMGLLTDEEKMAEEGRIQTKAEKRKREEEVDDQGEDEDEDKDKDSADEEDVSPKKRKRRRVTEPVVIPQRNDDESAGIRRRRKHTSLPAMKPAELNEEQKAEKRRRQTENARLARSQQAALRRAARDAAPETEKKEVATKARRREESKPTASTAYWPPRQRGPKRLKRKSQPLVRAPHHQVGSQEIDEHSTAQKEAARRRGLQVEPFAEQDLARRLSSNITRLAKLNAALVILGRKSKAAVDRCNELRYQRMAVRCAIEPAGQGHGVVSEASAPSMNPDVSGRGHDESGFDNKSLEQVTRPAEHSQGMVQTSRSSRTPARARRQFELAAANGEDVVMQEPTPDTSRRSSSGTLYTPLVAAPERHDSPIYPSSRQTSNITTSRQHFGDSSANPGAERPSSPQEGARRAPDKPHYRSSLPSQEGLAPLPYSSMHGAGAFDAADLQLPKTNKGGDPLLWTLRGEVSDDGNAKFWINKARQDGESDAARRRRIKRELREIGKWQAKTTGEQLTTFRTVLDTVADAQKA